MADNLAITVSADTAPLRAQLALGQADLRAISAEVKKTAAAFRAAGDDMKAGIMAQLQRQSSQLDAAASSVRRYGAEIKAALNPQPVQQFGLSMGTLREGLAAAGFLEAGREILGWSKSMAEAGETALNTAASLAMPIGKFIEISGAMRLMGADTEVGVRTLEHLQKSVSEGLGGNEKMVDTFGRLGISAKQLQATGGDLAAVFKLISSALQAHEGPNTAAAVYEILGTRLKAVIGFLREGPEAIDAAIKKFYELNPSAEAAAKAGGSTAEKIREVGVAASEISDQGFLNLKRGIDGALDSVRFLLSGLREVVRVGGAPVAKGSGSSVDLFSYLGQGAVSVGQKLFGGAPAMSYGIASAPPPVNYGHQFGPPQPATAKGDISPAPIKAGGKGGGNDLSEMHLRIAEAQDDTDKIRAIYEEWLASQKQTYGADSKEYRGLMVAKLQFEKQAQAQRFALGEEDVNAQYRVGLLSLAAFKSNMQAMVDQRRITTAQGLGFDIEYTAQLYTQERARLENVMANLAATKAQKLRAWEELATLDAKYTAQQSDNLKKIADDAKKTADAWAAPFKTAFDSAGSTFETAITGLIDRSKTLQQTWADIGKSATSAGISLAGSLASKAGGRLLGDLTGKGIGDVLGDKVLSMIPGLGTKTIADTAGATASAPILSAAMVAGATAAAPILSAAMAAGGGGGAGAGGILSAVLGVASIAAAPFTGGLSLLGEGATAAEAGLAGSVGMKLLTGTRGGIIPRASAGWSLPSSFGQDRMLGAFRPDEMVLPPNISRGMQDIIAQGGGAGGDTHVHPTVVINGPADAAQVARFFRDNHGHISDSLARAFRSNALTPRTI
jgi:hypothetical protein